MKRLTFFWFAAVIFFALAFSFTGEMSYAQQKMKVSASQKGWLGVSIQDITSEVRRAMDLDSRDGALISDVVKKSPADSAGFREKDIIVQFDGKKISDPSDLTEAVGETKPGTKVDVVVVRKGEKKTIGVVIGKLPRARSFVAVGPRGGNFTFFGGSSSQGMSLRQLNDQLAGYFGVPEGSGVLVWEVEKGSAADKAGIKAGDVVTVVGKKKIKEIRDVNRALGIYDPGEKADIEVVRKGSKQTVTMEIQENEEGEGFHYWFDGSNGPASLEMLKEGKNLNIRVPRIRVEHLGPEMDELKLHLEGMKEKIREDSYNLQDKIEREVRSKIRHHAEDEI